MFLYNIINKLQWLSFLIFLIIYKIKYKPNIMYMKKIKPLDNNLLLIKEKRKLLKMISKCLNKNIN